MSEECCEKCYYSHEDKDLMNRLEQVEAGTLDVSDDSATCTKYVQQSTSRNAVMSQHGQLLDTLRRSDFKEWETLTDQILGAFNKNTAQVLPPESLDWLRVWAQSQGQAELAGLIGQVKGDKSSWCWIEEQESPLLPRWKDGPMMTVLQRLDNLAEKTDDASTSIKLKLISKQLKVFLKWNQELHDKNDSRYW
ncbi:hypothetical protein PT974_08011 [Cladobotryum mycophilum]|uniref:Uncharacterized protein n=1 Tax=Cladobotryum mycophilum TaxID=491253 RepID=A0ABR0SDL4_9HYPO